MWVNSALKSCHETGKTGHSNSTSAPVEHKKINALSALSETVTTTNVGTVGKGTSSGERSDEPTAVTVSTVVKTAHNVSSTSSVTRTAQQAGDKANETAMKAYVCDVLVSDHNVSQHDCGLTGQRDIDSVTSRSVGEVTSSIADDFAKLQYVNVC
jgi:hypothetical protein